MPLHLPHPLLADAPGELCAGAVSDAVRAAASEAKWAETRAMQGSSYCPTAPLIAALLQHRCETRPPRPRKVNCFDSSEIPDWPIVDYVQYLCVMMQCSPSTWVHTLVYIDRLEAAGVEVPLIRMHRAFLTAAVMSAKMLDDSRRRNTSYAKLGGIAALEMNALEVSLLRYLDFDMHVTPDEWAAKARYVVLFGKAKGIRCRDAEALIGAMEEEVSLSQLRCRSPTFRASEVLAPHVSPQKERPSAFQRLAAGDHRLRSGSAAAPENGNGAAQVPSRTVPQPSPITQSTSGVAAPPLQRCNRPYAGTTGAIAAPVALAPTPPAECGPQRVAPTSFFCTAQAPEKLRPSELLSACDSMLYELSQQQKQRTPDRGGRAFARVNSSGGPLRQGPGGGRHPRPHGPQPQHAAPAPRPGAVRPVPPVSPPMPHESGQQASEHATMG